MKYRKLGKTGLMVSILSYGASSLGSVFRDTDERESVRTVHEAVDLGINLIDVSPYYGLTKAETVLGKALKDIPRDRYYLSTKAGRYGVDRFDFSKARIMASVEESLARLHVDYIDILYLHDIEFVPERIILEEALPALETLKEQGKIRFSGISGLPLAMFESMLPRIEVDSILSYCHYSLNDTTLLALLPLLEARGGVGLVNASPLSMGLLSARGAPDWHPADEEIRRVCRTAAELCASRGADIAKLAVQFSTSDERIPTTLVSTANPANLRNNARWVCEEMDRELLAAVQEALRPVKDRTWPSGRAEYNRDLEKRGNPS
ncbi:aldo/keto reductase [Paenibacillus sp.]|uniref:aldo/keto reductase n=1 Tax=Paenibacillus sp. TaxID=58172 RepID=UPI002D53D59B|nr:aldo/keto reductase [Paenibacillus sp.]HZG85951.1 aldo/keto reductase [Paenibacillus sp.]